MAVKWQYMKIDLHSAYDIESFTFNQGDEGWELVQIIPSLWFMETVPAAYAVFKRPDPQFVEELQGAAQGYQFVQSP